MNARRSVLPNSAPHILQPIKTAFGVLQVRLIAELGDHGLFLRHTTGETLLATHNNGFSCHELGKRMARGDMAAAMRQAQYILDCGGTARSLAHIAAIIA